MSQRFRETTIQSLLWLTITNIVGVHLALLLLAPEWGSRLAPFTYGRWIPVHLNAGLYGWCALPLVGLLLNLFVRDDKLDEWAVISLRAWTWILIMACASWLGGITSGKIFMEWAGSARNLFPAGLLFLWIVLAAGFRGQCLSRADAAWMVALKAALLILLASIPPLIYWAARPGIYPPINPDSGGATGGSLLGSTLAVIAMIMAAPLMVGLRPARARVVAGCLLLLAAHCAYFFALDHGNHSHHDRGQVAGLFSLALWWPVLVIYLRQFPWPAASRRWLYALCAWGAALLVTALFTFLPGVLEAWKFTNVLVSHSHIAMAGMLTAFNMIVLLSLSPSLGLDRPRPFWFWQAGCLVHVIALFALGMLESGSPAILYRGDCVTDLFYGLRLLGGMAMLGASADWLIAAWRDTS